jgi:hypothetical protein
MRTLILLALCAALISGCSVFGVRSDSEKLPYEVVEQKGELFEIRAYKQRLAAEVGVDPADGRNASFRILFDYISGGNQAAAKISMTSPVESDKVSEKISMTTPVETSQTGDNRIYMRFFLPGKYDRETAPVPLDQRVKIISIPAQTIAVLRFNGSGNEAAVAAKKRELLNSLADISWRPNSNPVAYFYDPPWTLPPFRRNEVAVSVTR